MSSRDVERSPPHGRQRARSRRARGTRSSPLRERGRRRRALDPRPAPTPGCSRRSCPRPGRRPSTPTPSRSRRPSRRRMPRAPCGSWTGTGTAPRAGTSARSSARRRRRRRPRGNLIANPGAEQGTAAIDDRACPAPPQWARTGAFTSVRYGTVAGVFAFPTLAAAATLRAGHAFFAAGPGGRGEPAPGRRRVALGAGDRRPLRGRDAPVGAARRLPRERRPRRRDGALPQRRWVPGSGRSRWAP